MSVVDYYAKLPKKYNKKYHNPGFKVHGIKVPFRALILGASGAGKTNVLIDLIYKMDKTFNTIVICVKSKEEPLYQHLAESAPTIEFREGINEIPDLDYFESAGQSLIVFDDLVLEKDQGAIAEFFIRGRKVGGGISCVYISQSYFSVPKVIRLQCNYIFIKKLNNKNELRRILDEFSLDLDLDELKEMYAKYTRNRLDFFLIDVENPDIERKYRHNYGAKKEEETARKSSSKKKNIPEKWIYGGKFLYLG